MTVYFSPNDRPFLDRSSTFARPSTLQVRIVHFHPFGPDSWSPTFFTNIDVTLLLDRPLSSLMAVQFSSFRPSIFFIKSSIFSLLDRPHRAFLTVDFYPSWPSSVLTLDRPVLCFRAVHYLMSRSFTFADRPLSVVWTVQFKPPWPSTLDWTPFIKNHFYWKIIVE